MDANYPWNCGASPAPPQGAAKIPTVYTAEDYRRVSSALRERVNAPTVTTVGSESLVVNLKQDEGGLGRPNVHWSVEQLTFLGTATVQVPAAEDMLSGLWLCPPNTPTESLLDGQAGGNFLARPYWIPIQRLAGGATLSQSVLSPANPIAGAEQVVTATTSFYLRSFSITLVTSAVGMPRTVSVVITNNGVTAFMAAVDLAGTVPAGGGTVRLVFGQGVFPTTPGVSVITGSLPQNLIVQAGWKIATLTDNRDAGDQFSNTQMVISPISQTSSLSIGGGKILWAMAAGMRIVVPQGWFVRAIVSPGLGTTTPGPGALSTGTLRGLVADEPNTSGEWPL